MGDTSREIGRGRSWRLPPLRRSGGGENRRGGRSQELQCSRVLYGSGGRGRALYGGGRVCGGVHSTRPSGERSYRGGGVCGGVHSTRPLGGAELLGRGPRKCTVREQGPQQSTVQERRSGVGSKTPVRRGGRSYGGEAREIRPWVETQVCKVTINCGYCCGRDRQPFAEI